MPHEIRFKNTNTNVIVAFDGKEVEIPIELADIIYSSLMWAIVEDAVKIVEKDGYKVYLTYDSKTVIKRHGNEVTIAFFDELDENDRALLVQGEE
jgi:hypothetical protein